MGLFRKALGTQYPSDAQARQSGAKKASDAVKASTKANNKRGKTADERSYGAKGKRS